MTDQPLDPAAIMAAHESHVWPNTRGCLYADMETDKPETQRCVPHRLAAALAAAQDREAALTKDRDGWAELAELRLAARMAVQGALTAEQETVRRVDELATRAAMLSTRISPSSVRAALAGEGEVHGYCVCDEPGRRARDCGIKAHRDEARALAGEGAADQGSGPAVERGL